MEKIPLLTSEDIEVKIKQVTKSGALLLLYKSSRTDRKILDQLVGPMNWTSDYKVVKDNLYCGIGVREDADHAFVWKWDCGIESASDDGTEKKAEASDAFKRAGFQWGIGAELYTSPMIWADVATVEERGKYYLQDKYAKYIVTGITYNEDTRVITSLQISNAKSGTVVFEWEMPTTGAMAKKMVKTIGESSSEGSVDDSEPPFEMDDKQDHPITKTSLSDLKKAVGASIKLMIKNDGNKNAYDEIIKAVTGDTTFKCNSATDDDYGIVEKIYSELISKGYGN